MKKLDLIEDRWLSIKEIAEYLGVLWQTVCVYFEKKNFSGYRIGKFRKFKIAEVDAGYIPDRLGRHNNRLLLLQL